ncbi:MAG: response regulator transcription factor [Lachnospiraceae bacterium]|nr:response regulator transcription factor [Lachnospiraceae bacterium]
MKIAVCDDDRTTREQIASLIKEHESDAEIITFEAGEDMIKSQENFAIYFLDVEMKEISGIDVAKHIREEQEKIGREKSIIIFVTGYREYMEDAFDVNAFHYLVKPVDEKKFYTVFSRALREVSVETKRKKLSVIVKHNGMQKKVLLKDIYYIESSNKKVVFHTKDGKLDTYGRMDAWESKLSDSFYRCHRGYLVNLEKITAYNADTIDVINGDSLILAQKKYSDFIKAYMRYAKTGGIVNV